MNPSTFLMVCLNIAVLTLFYTVLGGLLSYGLKNVFTPFDDTWTNATLGFKVGETSLELIVIGLIAYWSMYFIEKAPPLFPVSKKFDTSVDTYISGVFFVYAIFLFFDELWSKVQHIYTYITHIVLRKMDGEQSSDKKHQDGV